CLASLFPYTTLFRSCCGGKKMCVGRTERLHRRNYIGKDFFAKGERTRAANTCLASSLPRAQRRFPSPSPSPKEERAGERRPFFISFPSLQLSPRSFLAGREGKTPSAFFMANTISEPRALPVNCIAPAR